MEFTLGEIKGPKSVRAYTALQRLLLAICNTTGKSFEGFLKEFGKMNAKEKEEVIKASLLLVNLDDEEMIAVLGLCKDKNGISITASRIEHLTINEILENALLVFSAIAEINVFF